MKWDSIAKHAGKIGVYASSLVVGAFTIGTLFSAWAMIRPGRNRNFDCIGRINFGKLEPVSLRASDGVRLHAWVQLSPKATSNRWVLLLHGYRSDRAALQTRRRFFARRGYHILLLHFRGHGGSEAARISYGFNERLDVKAAMEFIRSSNPDQPAQIGINGVSMGAAAAAYAVAYESIHPDWIILESCYDDIHQALANRLEHRVSGPLVPVIARPLEFVGEHVFHLPIGDLNPAKALEKIQCPILVLAGDAEEILRAEDVVRLYRGIPEPKRLVFFRGAGHVDLLLYNPRRYIKAVGSFLREFSPRQPLEEKAAVPVMTT